MRTALQLWVALATTGCGIGLSTSSSLSRGSASTSYVDSRGQSQQVTRELASDGRTVELLAVIRPGTAVVGWGVTRFQQSVRWTQPTDPAPEPAARGAADHRMADRLSLMVSRAVLHGERVELRPYGLAGMAGVIGWESDAGPRWMLEAGLDVGLRLGPGAQLAVRAGALLEYGETPLTYTSASMTSSYRATGLAASLALRLSDVTRVLR